MATRKQVVERPKTWIRNSLLILCTFGMVISAYACYVEMVKQKDHSYRALCDLSESISCSKVFTSRWGKGFGLVEDIFGKDSFLNQPNSIFGMAFYAFQSTLALNPTSVGAVIQTGAAIIANIGSVYLGYVLFFILNDVCVICISTYIINFIILVVCVLKYKHAVAVESRKQR